MLLKGFAGINYIFILKVNFLYEWILLCMCSVTDLRELAACWGMLLREIQLRAIVFNATMLSYNFGQNSSKKMKNFNRKKKRL